jgi:galactokinase
LVDSAYNERRAQCEVAARFFAIEALRDVGEDEFSARMCDLDEVVRRRAHHVITENARTLRAATAMRAGDAPMLGNLMNESHASLRDDFQVSSAALDCMVEVARVQPGCYGARMTGAGFGGCVVALVEEESAADFASAVAPVYALQTGNEASIYLCRATNGAERV